MSNQNISTNSQTSESIFPKYSDYFKNKEIGVFVEEFFTNKCSQIIKDLNDLYNKGDLKKCISIIKNINENKLFRIFPKEKKIELLDIIIKKLLPNKFFYPSEILTFLGKIRFLIPQNYVIDWKYFYSLYYLFYQTNKMECPKFFFKSIHKLMPDNSMSLEDYTTIKKTFTDDLINNNVTFAIMVFIYFFPNKYINNDDQLQFQLFQMMKNSKKSFLGCCCMFSKILKKNGCLLFSKDETKNDEYIKIFIQYYFTNLSLYLLNDQSISDNSYVSPVFAKNDKKQKKRKFDHSIIDVLIGLIFNEKLKKYNSLIESNVKVLLTNKNVYIKEKTNDVVATKYLAFISHFIERIYGIFSTKKYDEQINKKIYTAKSYKNNEYLYERLLQIIKYFSATFKKCFLYENKGINYSQHKLFAFFSGIDINDNYMKELLANIDFDEYLKMLNFLQENSETKLLKFIKKFHSILPLLLSKYIYSKYDKVRILIKDIISFLPDCVTSANIDVNLSVLSIFGTYFYNIKNLVMGDKIYESLIPLINEASVKIMNNIVCFLDLICIKNNSKFMVFLNSLRNYLDKETLRQISKKYSDYIQDNEIESKYLTYYFNAIDEDEHIPIFKYIYNNLLYVDSSNEIKINNYFLYPQVDDELKINVPYCSLEITEKQSQKYNNFISLLDYSKILVNNPKNIKYFYQIYFALINQEEQKLKRLGTDLFNYAFNSLINCHVDTKKNLDNNNNNEKDLIEYPSKENIDLVCHIYKKIILPYEKYILDYLSNNDNKEVNPKTIEQILYIYALLIKNVCSNKFNILLLLNSEDISITEYKDIQNQLSMYNEIKQYIKTSLNTISKIYEYNQKFPEKQLFSSQNINLTFEEIIQLYLNFGILNNDDRMKNKNERKINYKYYHLNNFKQFWVRNNLQIKNYDYYTMINYFIPKDDLYYTFLKIYSLNCTSVNLQSSIIGRCKNYIYAINKEKMKDVYENVFSDYRIKLSKISEETETDKNVMKNISDIFLEYSYLIITLFPFEPMKVLQNLFVMLILLKIKKYSNIGKYFGSIIMNSRMFLNSPTYTETKYQKMFNKYSGKNDIILDVFKKMTINENIKENNTKYNNIVKEIIEIILKGLTGQISNYISGIISQEENPIGENVDQSINDQEVTTLFFRLKHYITDLIDKNDDLYKEIIKMIINNITISNIPISTKNIWLKILFLFIKEEYSYNKEYKWIRFNSEEEYLSNWDNIKYEIKGKDKIISAPLSSIRKSSFKYQDNLKNNIKYIIDVKNLLEIIHTITEWKEDQKLMMKEGKPSFMEFKFHFLKEIKGLDYYLVKLFYYMLELRYIDYDTNDFVKHYTLNDNKENKNIVYEFLLARYYYMLNNSNLFNEEAKTDFWKIMNFYTNRINKKEDEKIFSIFNFLFKNCNLTQLEKIFNNSNFYQHPVDFVSKIYNIYYQELPNLRSEAKIFDNVKTKELINQIMSNDENIILYSDNLLNILEMHFYINGYLKRDYYSFKNIYTKEILEQYNELLTKKDFSKHSRFALFEIYCHLFPYINDELKIFKSIISKIALCINEFKTNDKGDLGSVILQRITNKFSNFNEPINFPLLCDKIIEINKEDNNSNDTNKSLYLQIINLVYKNQKHFNINKYSSQEIFDSLYKVFDSIKNEDLKIKFAPAFASYFNDLSEEENIKFIQEHQDIIFKYEDKGKENEFCDNYVYILMSQLLRFKESLPEYIQQFIIRMKKIDKKNSEVKKIVMTFLKSAMDYYHGSYIYMKNYISFECKNVLEELTIEKSYFV